ncbi:MAG: GNAT family N-acetyltransferase [Mangrovibacterium sp.]
MNSKQIIFKPIFVEDAPILIELARETFYDQFISVNTEKDMQYYLGESFSLDKIIDEIRNVDSIFYFAELGGEKIGYLKLNKNKASDSTVAHNTLEIERLYLCKKYTSQGIGQQLMDKALSVAMQQGVSSVWLGAWENNKRAQSFYRRNGFKAIGHHIFMIGSNSHNDLILQKKFY